MQRRLTSKALLTLCLFGLFGTAERALATATYQGTMSGTFEILSCTQQGVSLASCGFAGGLTINGFISSPSLTGGTAFTFGGGTASVVSTISTVGPGTFVPHPFIQGALSGSGLDIGSGYSVNIAISGSASAPGDGAGSVAFESGDFSFINQGAFPVTIAVELTYQYESSISVNDPTREQAFSNNNVDVQLFDFVADPSTVTELFDNGCTNILPPFLGIPSIPCTSSGLQTLQFSFVVPVCPAPICLGVRVDGTFQQLGAAAVVPEPTSIALLAAGFGCLGLYNRFKRRRRERLDE
jgi:hypothetical protein